ncbi:hypothetical protein DTO169C6_3530 [Paecilomyces variotii]|nr:hypothetical protein DTO169C6_3530 [Paecilomyces variotii]KAJ9349848.1 hypothetical protein DTO027B9_7300 [Paecilomyces variotii]
MTAEDKTMRVFLLDACINEAAKVVYNAAIIETELRCLIVRSSSTGSKHDNISVLTQWIIRRSHHKTLHSLIR